MRKPFWFFDFRVGNQRPCAGNPIICFWVVATGTGMRKPFWCGNPIIFRVVTSTSSMFLDYVHFLFFVRKFVGKGLIVYQ
jgi:hypothetical protein